MVKMSHSFGKADPPKRVAYTVSDDWTSARRGNKKLRLCALGTALDRPRETIPSTFDQQLEAAIGSGTNWVEVARRLPKPRTSQKLDAPKPLDRQEDIRPEWASPDPANSSGAISDYEMQILLLEQQNKKRLLMSRTSQDLNMPKPLDPQIPARPEWGAREPMSSDAALSDHQMQMMSLEQQNKKRLLMPRDSPLLDDGTSDLASPTTGQSNRKRYNEYPLVPSEAHRNVYPTTPGQRDRDRSSPTFIQDMRESRNVQTIQSHSSHFAHARMTPRNGLPPNSRPVSAARQNAESLFRQEAELRRRHDEQPPSLQQPKVIYPVAQQVTPRDATGFYSPVFGAAPTEMPGRPSRIKRRTQGPLAQSYSLPLPSNAHTKQVLAGVDKYLEQRRTRPRTREISSRLRGHTRDEPLMERYGPWE
jgi:hypothetical protein